MRGTPRCIKRDSTAYLIFVKVSDSKQWKGHTHDCFWKQDTEHKPEAKQKRGSILQKGKKQKTKQIHIYKSSFKGKWYRQQILVK